MMQMAERMFAEPQRMPRNDRKAEASSSPVSLLVKKNVPMEVRNSEDRLKSVRGPAIARPGLEVKRRVEAVTAEKYLRG